MSKNQITIDGLPRDEIKANVIRAFKDFLPETVIAFYDDESFPEKIKKENFIDNGINIIAFDFLAIGKYDSTSSMVFELFCYIVDNGGDKAITEEMCHGADNTPYYIAGCSHLIHKAWLMSIVYYLMARYGFYFKYNDEIHLEMYSRVFHMAFHEYDDDRRNRLSRRELCKELVRWDVRNKDYFSKEIHGFHKAGTPELSKEEKDNKHKLFVACKEEFEKYPFAGENRLGTFISGYGYLAPGETTNDFVGIIEDRDRVNEVINSFSGEMQKLVKNAYFSYFFSSHSLLRYLNEHSVLDTTHLSLLKYIEAGKNEDGYRVLIFKEEYYTASPADIITDRARIYALMGFKIPDIGDMTPKSMKEIKEELKDKKEEDNNGNS